MNIEGRRVLITGASRGLGRTLAFALAEAGAREVFGGTRKSEDAEALQRDANAVGAPITPIQLDVTNHRDVEAAARLGTIDILINNAGIAGYGNPVSMDFASAIDEMNVNYFGALLMTRALAPAMIERREGMIVNVATAFAKIKSAHRRNVLCEQSGVVISGPSAACLLVGPGRTRDDGDADDV